MLNTSPILVTGASGFIAAHTILHLLEQGHRVRGTLRDLKKAPELRATLAGHTGATDALEFVRADLLQDAGWAEAVAGCTSVIHAASPVPIALPKDENDLIVPARDGTMRVLRAAHAAGVRRTAIISSSAAVTPGHEGENRTLDENDWARLERRTDAYAKSKTLAERAAWEFIRGPENTGGMELVALNPPYVQGPLLDRHYVASGELILTLLRRQLPGVPRIKFPFVDVRDLAAALALALTTPAAAGQRLCCVAVSPWMEEIATTLARRVAARGYRIPTRRLPSLLVRAIALFDIKVRRVVNTLDWDYTYSNARIKAVLGWQPRDSEQTIADMAESMIRLGLA